MIALAPAAPYAALARAQYQLGVVYDRMGQRNDAVTAYQRALAAIPSEDRLRSSNKVREGLKRPPIGRVCR